MSEPRDYAAYMLGDGDVVTGKVTEEGISVQRVSRRRCEVRGSGGRGGVGEEEKKQLGPGKAREMLSLSDRLLGRWDLWKLGEGGGGGGVDKRRPVNTHFRRTLAAT